MKIKDINFSGRQSCPKCGSSDLSFGGGHVGNDEITLIETSCNNCGNAEEATVLVPDPCWICGSKIESSDLHLTIANQWQGATGKVSFTGIPGVPSECNCHVGCLSESHKKISQTIGDLFAEGWDGSM